MSKLTTAAKTSLLVATAVLTPLLLTQPASADEQPAPTTATTTATTAPQGTGKDSMVWD
ncbi:hypothetical protein AB0F11_01660 [Streptomyces sp. NPDC032472]|uniref:hypothetical protein n=1 Tax=Streptomyces sp. NPDC032472 TaxID=3155018 RepID=UPI003411C52E